MLTLEFLSSNTTINYFVVIHMHRAFFRLETDVDTITDSEIGYW